MLQQTNKAIKAYHAVNGVYPDTSGSWATQWSDESTFIPGLVPDFVSKLPKPPQLQGSPVLYYLSNGTDYKLLYLYPSTQAIPSSVANNSTVSGLIDPKRPTRGWGYWSSGGTGF